MNLLAGFIDFCTFICNNIHFIGLLLLVAIIFVLHVSSFTQSITENNFYWWDGYDAIFRLIDYLSGTLIRKKNSVEIMPHTPVDDITLHIEPLYCQSDKICYGDIMNIYRTQIVVPRLPANYVLRI